MLKSGLDAGCSGLHSSCLAQVWSCLTSTGRTCRSCLCTAGGLGVIPAEGLHITDELSMQRPSLQLQPSMDG